MKVFVIGSGAREHALVWKLVSERSVSEVVCAPGNPGIAQLARCVPADVGSPANLLAVAREQRTDLTIVGPELPLERGAADLFAAEGMPCLGPVRAAARLETSKAFAKAFMARHAVPTARHVTCATPEHALSVVDSSEFGFPVVLKADGLAAGKGVVVAHDSATATAAIQEMMIDRRFGDAGASVVVEEFLIGREASFFVMCDGTRGVAIGTAEDHKRAFDDDEGPNTGGMGAFAPSPAVDADVHARVMREIVEPVLAGLRGEGTEFRGFLYVGLMLTAGGPKVVEFNVRLGDPEAQVLLPLLESELSLLAADAAAGSLSGDVRLSNRRQVGIVLASAGYPGQVQTGHRIHGVDAAERMRDVMVFHSGTGIEDGRLVTQGGRVLTVVAGGEDYAEAMDRAYSAANMITFEGRHMRTDIGRRALA